MDSTIINGTQKSIIGYLLSNPEDPPTIRSISRSLKKSYPLTYNNIHKLEEYNIVEKRSVPPAQIVSITKSAPKELLIGVESRRKEDFINKYLWIKVMLNETLVNTELKYFTLLVFGSYAKVKETNKSDIDLLAIVPKREDISEIENAIRKTYTKVRKNIIIVDTEDFKKMIKNQSEFNVGNEAIKHHILLYGGEQFYELI